MYALRIAQIAVAFYALGLASGIDVVRATEVAKCLEAELPIQALVLADRRVRVEHQLRRELGIPAAQVLLLGPPDTLPTSGAEIFLLRHSEGETPFAVAKIFPSGSKEHEQEISALKFLASLELRKSRSPAIRKSGRLQSTGEPLLITDYAGTDLEELTGRLKNGDMRIHDAVREIGPALAEFHARGPHLPSSHPEVKGYLDYELGKVRTLNRELADSGSVLRQRLISRVLAKPTEIFRFRQILEAAADRYEKSGVLTPSVAHGDAHPGNFAYRSDLGPPAVSLFDAPALDAFKDGHGDPMADVGRFSAGLMVAALDAGVVPVKAETLQKEFIDAYLRAAGQSFEANQAAIEFHQLRFYGVVLSEITRERLKISDLVRARMIKYVLGR